MGENRNRARLERPVRVVAPADDLPVVEGGAAAGAENIVHAVDLIQMRSLGPYAAVPVPDAFRLCQRTAGFDIDPVLNDMGIQPGAVLHGDIYFAVVIEE